MAMNDSEIVAKGQLERCRRGSFVIVSDKPILDELFMVIREG